MKQLLRCSFGPRLNTLQMKTTKTIFLLLSIALLSGCVSTTLIQSDPPGAKLYLNGEFKGETPYTHVDEKIIFSTTQVKLSKEGYEDHYDYFTRDEQPNVGAIVGGFFIWPIWLWALDYYPERMYKLDPAKPAAASPPALPGNGPETTENTKTVRLRELKQLLDEGILTQEEFDSEKKKILEEK